MPRALLLTATLLTSALASAQTPIQPPAPIERPTSISTWPTPQTLRRNTRLILTTTSPYPEPYLCRLDHIDADHIACRSPHHAPPILFDRPLISTIEVAHPPTLYLSSTYFAVSGSLVVIGLSCALLVVGADAPCAILAAAGLFGLLAGAAIDLVTTAIDIPRTHHPTLIYIAPPPSHT